jgi:PadR family transcriptional regulator, regulatory protein PadR
VAGSDLYSGTLTVLILKALDGGPLHGYAIGRWIRERTGEVLLVQEGVLYLALHRLAAKGWLDESWGVTDNNREAKFYKLTPVGRRHLKAELNRWDRHTRAIASALNIGRG